jgi:glycosyltransferase involved in cell wall biosynthesis
MCDYLFLIGALGGGGSERQLIYVAAGLAARGFRVGIVVWNFDAEERYSAAARAGGVELHPFASGASAVAKLVRLRRLIFALRPRVLHSYSFYLNVFAQLAAAGSKTLAVGSVRSSLHVTARNSGHIAGRLNARWPRVQVYNNNAAAGEAKRRRFFRPREIAVVANRVPLPQYIPPPVAGPVSLIAIGSLREVKRWDRLLRACLSLKRAGHSFRCTILGEGSRRGQLEALRHSLGLDDEVAMPGWVDDPSSRVAESWFLVHTSDSEGSPNAVMEAAAAGRAVVTTDVGDVRGFVVDGESGFVVARDDEAALADRMARLASSPGLCVRMGERARELASRCFGLDLLVDEMLNVYSSRGHS